jgi:hypothetical protein
MEIRLRVLSAVFKLGVVSARLIRQGQVMAFKDVLDNIQDILILKDAAVGTQCHLPHGRHNPRPVNIEVFVARALFERRNYAVDPPVSLDVAQGDCNGHLGSDYRLGIDRRARVCEQFGMILE